MALNVSVLQEAISLQGDELKVGWRPGPNEEISQAVYEREHQ